MSCPSITCPCARCTRLRRGAYRDGLIDAHRVYARLHPELPVTLARVSPGLLKGLAPHLDELEWSGRRELLGGAVVGGACPECGSNEATQEHAGGCYLAELIALARIAAVQPDLFQGVC